MTTGDKVIMSLATISVFAAITVSTILAIAGRQAIMPITILLTSMGAVAVGIVLREIWRKQ